MPTDWYTSAGPHWWARRSFAVRAHLETFALEVGERVVASAYSELNNPWNWRQLFPRERRPDQLVIALDISGSTGAGMA